MNSASCHPKTQVWIRCLFANVFLGNWTLIDLLFFCIFSIVIFFKNLLSWTNSLFLERSKTSPERVSKFSSFHKSLEISVCALPVLGIEISLFLSLFLLFPLFSVFFELFFKLLSVASKIFPVSAHVSAE